MPPLVAVTRAFAGFSFGPCGVCDEDPLSLFSVENVLHCQKVSDFLIALAYFSIPLELFYFVTYAAIFPFRWILVQFGAFIVLCGLTHLATVFTYAPHSFLLMLVLTVLKFLTALVSIATAITLLPLIPQILRVFVREGLLRKKTRDLDREVGLMKRQEAAGWRVREIIREIRRSLDRRMIIDTAIAELAKVLHLESCAVWMPDLIYSSNTARKKLVLRHEIKPHRHRGRPLLTEYVPADDREVAEIFASGRIVFLRPSSRLLCQEEGPFGPAVAVRIPMRRASNSQRDRKTEEDQDHAILVLSLPADEDRAWSPHDLEILEVVADQVSVGLSHSLILEETLATREKLQERNAMLKHAQRQALKANETRALVHRVMSREMMAPVRAVAAVFSALQLERLKPEQLTMARGGLILSSLVQDMADVSTAEESKVEVSPRPFAIRSALVEAVTVSKLLCYCRGIKFECAMVGKIPAGAVGDEKRIVEAVLSMITHVLGSGGREPLSFRILVEEGSQGGLWKQNLYDDSVKLGFEVRRAILLAEEDHPPPTSEPPGHGGASGHGHAITVCEQLARLMNGNLSVGSASQSHRKVMSLVVKLQRQRSRELMDSSRTMLDGMRILLVDGDSVSRNAARRSLERVGCVLKAASSWFECSELLVLRGSMFHVLLIDADVLRKEGQDMATQLRKLCSKGRLVAIAMVPKGDNEAAAAAACGVQGAIAKPLVLQELALELGRVTKLLHPSALPLVHRG